VCFAAVWEVLHDRVRAGEVQAFVAVVAPTDQPRWRTIFAVDLEDLGVLVGLPDVVALDDEAVTDCCTHEFSP
jgi:hypothetical protein